MEVCRHVHKLQSLTEIRIARKGVVVGYREASLTDGFKYLLGVEINILMGFAIALFCNSVIFPWSTVNQLTKEVCKALDNLNHFLPLSVKYLLAELSTPEQQLVSSLQAASMFFI